MCFFKKIRSVLLVEKSWLRCGLCGDEVLRERGRIQEHLDGAHQGMGLVRNFSIFLPIPANVFKKGYILTHF